MSHQWGKQQEQHEHEDYHKTTKTAAACTSTNGVCAVWCDEKLLQQQQLYHHLDPPTVVFRKIPLCLSQRGRRRKKMEDPGFATSTTKVIVHNKRHGRITYRTKDSVCFHFPRQLVALLQVSIAIVLLLGLGVLVVAAPIHLTESTNITAYPPINQSVASNYGRADNTRIGGLTIADIFQQHSNDTFPQPSKTRNMTRNQLDGGITVGVYYYPWHGPDFHRGSRGDGYLRSQLQPPQYPMLGEYDDRRPEIVSQHLLWSQQANVKLWICSWWGPGKREDTTIRNVIFKHAELPQSHKIALLYEGSGRGIKASDGWNTQNVYPDMEYICTTYFAHSNYYRVRNGKPVIVIYLTRQMQDQGILTKVLTEMRMAAQDKCQTELFIIGDHVWKRPPSDAQAYYEPFDTDVGLDAVTNYDVYGNVGSTPYATQQVLNEYYKNQNLWKAFCISKGVQYIPGVAPGYNDRGVRLKNNNRGLSRRLSMAQDEAGTLFASHLVQARQLTEPDLGHLLLVNSWNEWHEDSQIEPVGIEACGGEGATTTNLPSELTSNLDYECYGTKYLDILRNATCPLCPFDDEQKYRGVALLRKDPFSQNPPPAKTLVGTLYYTHETERSQFRNRLSTRQNIVTGDYTSIDATIVTRHLEYSRQANIGLWIVEWNGQGTTQDTLLQTELLARQDLHDLQVSVLYQVRERVNEQAWDYAKIQSDLQHLFTNIVTNTPHFYRIRDRPVLFLSSTRWFRAKEQLQTLTNLVREVANNHGVPKVYIVGDQIGQDLPVADDYSPFELLDAIVNIDVYSNFQSMNYGDEGKEMQLDAFYRQQREWRDIAWRSSCGYVPSVMTGFNNGKDAVVSRQLNATSAPGSFFKASLLRARYLTDSTLNGLLVVASFNRFREDTQIEPVVGKTTSEPVELTQNTSYYGYGNLYLDILYDYTKPLNVTVKDEPDIEDFFVPMKCNNGLSPSSCTSTWIEVFGSATTHNKTITIPCGLCVLLDQRWGSSHLNLLGGLDILGMLYIRNIGSLLMSTPFIRVQGEFRVDAMDAVSGTPNIQINMVESSRLGIEKFIPSSSNAFACGVGRCEPGLKSLFVAGGKVHVQGMPMDAPTWVELVDVVPPVDQVLPEFSKPAHCPTSGILVHENFQSSSTAAHNVFRPNVGTSVEIHGTFWEVQERRSVYSGTHVDIKNIRDCLEPSKPYEFSLRVRMVKEGYQGTPTQCAAMGINCIAILLDSMKDSLDAQISEQIYSGPSNQAVNYGDWMDIIGTLSFTQAQLSSSNVYASLRIAGGEQNVGIELDNFVLQSSQSDACSVSTADCRDLVICNGHAEYGSATPFAGTGGGQPTIKYEQETENNFWHLEDGGMTWAIPSKCMINHALYKLEMKLRADPLQESISQVTVAVYLKSGSVFKKVAVCSERNGEWTVCKGFVKITESLVENPDDVSMLIQRIRGGSYDIDDLGVRFSHLESAVTGLVVPKAIQQKWFPGAQILVTSQSLLWDKQETRTIEAVEDFDSSNVVLKLDSAIPRPSNEQDYNFPIEVALLSRNVVINDGRLTVYRTPNVVQVVKGVKFENLQIYEESNRHPILAYQSKSVAGSEFSMNSILDSQNGCIVIENCDSLSMEDNIAFQTTGHCFALTTGKESDITIRRNIGAQTRFDASTSSAATFFLGIHHMNTVENNIAAGSQGIGFQIQVECNMSSNRSPLEWNSNRAHSNRIAGIMVTVSSTPNFIPNMSTILMLKDIQSYRNHGVGLALQADYQMPVTLAVESVLLADNRGGMSIDGFQTFQMRNSTVYGQSASLHLIEHSHDMTAGSLLCDGESTYAGIELVGDGTKVVIQDIRAIGFYPTDDMGSHCVSHLLKLASRRGNFTNSGEITLLNVTSEHERAPSVDFCSASKSKSAELADSLITGCQNGDSPFMIVSNTHSALVFLPSDTTTISRPEDCAMLLLSDSCLRTVEIAIDPKHSQSSSNLVLKICDRASMQSCRTYEAKRGTTTTLFGVLPNLYFLISLPHGRYEATILDAITDVGVWPTFMHQIWRGVTCKEAKYGNLGDDGSILLLIPSLSLLDAQCQGSLLREEPFRSSITTIKPQYWIGLMKTDGQEEDIQVVPSPGSANKMMVCQGPNVKRFFAGQYLDTRCLVEQKEYQFSVVLQFFEVGIAAQLRKENSTTTSNETDFVEVTHNNIREEGESTGSAVQVGILFSSRDGQSAWTFNLNLGIAASASEWHTNPPNWTAIENAALPSVTRSSSLQPHRRGRVNRHEQMAEASNYHNQSNRIPPGPNENDEIKVDDSLADKAHHHYEIAAFTSNSDSVVEYRSTFELDYDMANASSALFFIQHGNSGNQRLCIDAISIIPLNVETNAK